MFRVLKYIGIAVGAVILLLIVCVAGLYAWTSREVSKSVPVPAHGFTAPTDSASIARGEHVTRALAKCGDCHGADFGGDTLIDDPAFGTVYAPNLTRGQGGVMAAYSDAELEAAIRHGIRRNGQRLMIMPSQEFQLLSDEDLGAVIAYIRSQPPVDRAPLTNRLGPIARGLYAGGVFPLFPAKIVTHGTEMVPSVAVDSTVAYGKYLADMGCAGCHGVGYGGGPIPGGPPEWPKPANLTPEGIGHYTQDDFVKALRTGVRPNGVAINEFMPIQATKLMTDTEIVAVYKYLKTVPSKAFGTR